MRQTILIIDDSPSIHALAKALLAEEPVDIHSALDADFGLEQAESLLPDLILLDVDMPRTDGFEACRRLKANRATADLPVIFLTSHSATDEKVRGLELGAMDYVAKPFNRSELWARVRSALRVSHLVKLLEGRALLDPLTGLGNRAMFERQMAAEVSLRGHHGTPLSCILIEVDHLDVINDQYGQACGDRVLQKVSEIVVSHCRPEEVACRYGGTKFVVIVTHATAQEALGVAGRMRDAVRSAEFVFQGVPVRVTASFAVTDADDLRDHSMVDRAEGALLQAKAVWQANAPPPPEAEPSFAAGPSAANRAPAVSQLAGCR